MTIEEVRTMRKPVSGRDAELALIYRDGILDYDAHDAMLRSLGYEYIAGSICNCPGSDDDGHLPACGWFREPTDLKLDLFSSRGDSPAQLSHVR